MDSSVFRIRVLSDNRVIRSSNPLAEVPQGGTDLDEDSLPRSFYNGDGEFMFVRNIQASTTAYHLATKRVTLLGEDRDPNMFVQDDSSRGVLNGAIAVNIGTQYLVAWMDGRRLPGQPDRQTNIYGVFLDGSLKGDDALGYVRAVARANPAIGVAPLTTNFGASGSIGTVDSILWEFGDGETKDVAQTSHKFETAGDYIAILSLFRRGLAARDFVRIFVDSASKGALGGPAQTVAGTVVSPSANVNPDILLATVTESLNLAKTNSDATRVFGYIAPEQIRFSQTDVPVSVTLAGRTISFLLTSNGTYASELGARPIVRFTLNRFSGLFELVTSQDSVFDLLSPLGVTNSTVRKPGQEILLPVSMSYNDISITETLTSLYVATAGKNGLLETRLGSVGSPGTGFFRLLNALAKEKGKKPNLKKGIAGKRTHQLGVSGAMGPAGPDGFTKAASGFWRISIGNDTEDIPVASLTETKNGYQYKGPRGGVGVQELTYTRSSGRFLIIWNNLPAEGDEPSGMPVSDSPVTSADLAVNVELDLIDGGKFTAGAYARFSRSKLNSKKWTTR
jgi:hypothetical protein